MRRPSARHAARWSSAATEPSRARGTAEPFRRLFPTRIRAAPRCSHAELKRMRRGATIGEKDVTTPPRPLPGRPDETPRPGPRGPRTPYPVNDPEIANPDKPGAEPDYIPATPPDWAPQR